MCEVNMKVKTMKENKDQPSKVSTCFEESPCAEMMQKIMSEQGIGSLCDEMMRTLMKRCQEGEKEPQAAENDEGHEREDKSNQTEE